MIGQTPPLQASTVALGKCSRRTQYPFSFLKDKGPQYKGFTSRIVAIEQRSLALLHAELALAMYVVIACLCDYHKVHFLCRVI